VVLMHYRCSSAVFQTFDAKESAAIRALVDLCVRRRNAASPEGERRPLVLCVVSRDGTLKDNDLIAQGAKECGGLVDADDLGREQTLKFVTHLLKHRQLSGERLAGAITAAQRHSSIRAKRFSATSRQHTAEVPAVLQTSSRCTPVQKDVEAPIINVELSSPKTSLAVAPKPPEDKEVEVLAEYIFETTGGNPLGVMTMLQELERQEVLVPDTSQLDRPLMITSSCLDVAWLRNRVQPPQSLVAMAFSVFERSDPKSQMVLKAASTLGRDFGLFELKAALEDLSMEELMSICKRLSQPGARTLRRVNAASGSSPSGTGRASFSLAPDGKPGPLQSAPMTRRPSLMPDSRRTSLSTQGRKDTGSPRPLSVSPGPSSSSIRHGPRASVLSPTMEQRHVHVHAHHAHTHGSLLPPDKGDGRRKSELRRASRVVDTRYEFYWQPLRHVASTLLLESQRAVLHKNHTTNMEDFSDDSESAEDYSDDLCSEDNSASGSD